MIRFSAAVTSLAALSLVATPAGAVGLPSTQAPANQAAAPAQMEAHGWGYGRYDRYDHYGRYDRHRRHRGNGIGAGDVIAGVLVIGAIAAIASSASNRSRERYDERYPRRDPAPADYRRDYRNSDSGIDRAVDMCVDQAERGSARVDSVDEAARRPDGWRVSGRMADGEAWRCWIDNDGRLRSLDFGTGYVDYDDGGAYTSAAASGQLSDEAYARARSATRYGVADRGYSDGGGIDGDLTSGAMPAYPGGPLPGEAGYDGSVGG